MRGVRTPAHSSVRRRRACTCARRVPSGCPEVPHSQLSKKEKEQQRKERQRHAKIDLAREMMDVALAVMEESGVRCVCVGTLLRCCMRCLGHTAY